MDALGIWLWIASLFWAGLIGFKFGIKSTHEDIVMRGLGRYNPMTRRFEWLKGFYKDSNEREYEPDT